MTEDAKPIGELSKNILEGIGQKERQSACLEKQREGEREQKPPPKPCSKCGLDVEHWHVDSENALEYYQLEKPGWVLRPCGFCQEQEREDEQKRKQREAVLEALLNVMGRRYRHATFDSFVCNPKVPEQAVALAKCRGFVSNFKVYQENGKTLLLVGNIGTGKTHLAAAIYREWPEHVVYYPLVEFFSEIKASFKSDYQGWPDPVTKVCEANLLIFDDVGVQGDTEWENLQVFRVLDHRYRQMKPTVLISNLAFSELKELLGDRLIDRLSEAPNEIIVFDWASNRGK